MTPHPCRPFGRPAFLLPVNPPHFQGGWCCLLQSARGGLGISRGHHGALGKAPMKHAALQPHSLACDTHGRYMGTGPGASRVLQERSGLPCSSAGRVNGGTWTRRHTLGGRHGRAVGQPPTLHSGTAVCAGWDGYTPHPCNPAVAFSLLCTRTSSSHSDTTCPGRQLLSSHHTLPSARHPTTRLLHSGHAMCQASQLPPQQHPHTMRCAHAAAPCALRPAWHCSTRLLHASSLRPGLALPSPPHPSACPKMGMPPALRQGYMPALVPMPLLPACPGPCRCDRVPNSNWLTQQHVCIRCTAVAPPQPSLMHTLARAHIPPSC